MLTSQNITFWSADYLQIKEPASWPPKQGPARQTSAKEFKNIETVRTQCACSRPRADTPILGTILTQIYNS